MSNKRKAEIIKLLTSTIESEKNKSGGGNQKTISDFKQKSMISSGTMIFPLRISLKLYR